MESIKSKKKYKLKTLLTNSGLLLFLNGNHGGCSFFGSKKPKTQENLGLNVLKNYKNRYESQKEIKNRPYKDKRGDSSGQFPDSDIAPLPLYPISFNNNGKLVKTDDSPVGDSKEKKSGSALVNNKIAPVSGYPISSNNNYKAVETNDSPLGDSKDKKRDGALANNNIKHGSNDVTSCSNKNIAPEINDSPVGDSKEKKSNSALPDKSTSGAFSDVSLCDNSNASIKPSLINLGKSQQNYELIRDVPPVLPTFSESLANLEDSGWDSQSNSSTCQTFSQGNDSASCSTNDIQDHTYEIPNNPKDNIYETLEDCKQRSTIPEAINPPERTNLIRIVQYDLKSAQSHLDELIKNSLIYDLIKIQDTLNRIIAKREGDDDILTDKQKNKLQNIKVTVKSGGSYRDAVELYNKINSLESQKLLTAELKKEYEQDSKNLREGIKKILKDVTQLEKGISEKNLARQKRGAIH